MLALVLVPVLVPEPVLVLALVLGLELVQAWALEPVLVLALVLVRALGRRKQQSIRLLGLLTELKKLSVPFSFFLL